MPTDIDQANTVVETNGSSEIDNEIVREVTPGLNEFTNVSHP
jgi:hypothetical protein